MRPRLRNGVDASNPLGLPPRTYALIMKHVTVTIDETHRAAVSQISEQLQQRGMEVDSVLEGLGMVTGTTRDLETLRTVVGVESVDETLGFQLPDPDQNLQ